MTRTREDGKEEVFSACIKHDDTRYLGGNKSSSVVATKLQGRIFLLILKLLNMIGVFILKIEKKILNLKYNILWLKINLKMILLELYAF